MNLREKAAAETRKKLLKTGQKLIMKSGLSNVSVEDITNAAGVAKGTFYTYFKRKEDIVCEICREPFADIAKCFRESKEPSIEKKLAVYFNDFMTEVQRYGINICREWLRDVITPANVTDAKDTQKWQYDTKTLLDMLNFAVKNGADDNQAYYALKVKLANGLTVLNYHGYWKPDPIGDDMTVRCMRKVADMIRSEKGPVLMCGDLNVVYESPAMRELDFLTDLTHETNTKQTLMNLKFVKDVACDHILISDGLKWSNFEVHKELVSDHAAVSADIEI
jgi:AcrR family transcriptional regulator